MRLPIADCRLPIKKSFSCGSFARRCHDGGKLIGFIQKRRKFARRHDARLDEQFEPKRRFISLLLDCSDFGNEFSLTTGTTTGAIVGRHRSSAAQYLLGDDAGRVIVLGNRPGQLDDSQGEGFGSGFQFGWIPAARLQTQSAIGNRQSAIPR